MRNRSQELYKKACTLIPGGVNSPVRAFKSVGLDPLYIDHGKGSKIYDVDKNEYLDYVESFGLLILGHAHSEIIKTIQQSAQKGLSFGACHENEAGGDPCCGFPRSFPYLRSVFDLWEEQGSVQ